MLWVWARSPREGPGLAAPWVSQALRGRPVSLVLFVVGVSYRRLCLSGKPNEMQNDAGEFVDLYVPRKW